MRQLKDRGIMPELRNFIIDYERVNELCDGTQLDGGYTGTINSKGTSNRNIKQYIERFQEILQKKEMNSEYQYIVDTLKYNKILINLRQEKIENILND